jgi:2-dehydropantoate 2-reductase
MKILVLGAGATGGYFGGRLLEKGEDVTFLVREKREIQLKKDGLVIKSIHGDVTLQPNTIRSEKSEDAPFDIVFVATKAYHLKEAMEAVDPFVRDYTLVIPLLNGIEHIEELYTYFSEDKIIGGLCFIESTLDEQGHIIQTSEKQELVFGEMSGGQSERIQKLNKLFEGTKASFRLSDNIQQDLWHKYLFITTLSGITSLMRSSIGPIRDTLQGRTYIQQLFEEVRLTMLEARGPIADGIVEQQMSIVNQLDSKMKSSMLRDIEKNQPIEADHIQGYLLLLAERGGIETPLLRLIYQHLKVYEKNIS